MCMSVDNMSAPMYVYICRSVIVSSRESLKVVIRKWVDIAYTRCPPIQFLYELFYSECSLETFKPAEKFIGISKWLIHRKRGRRRIFVKVIKILNIPFLLVIWENGWSSGRSQNAYRIDYFGSSFFFSLRKSSKFRKLYPLDGLSFIVRLGAFPQASLSFVSLVDLAYAC